MCVLVQVQGPRVMRGTGRAPARGLHEPATPARPLASQGLLNLSACEWGAPGAMSKPMFFGASNSLRDGVVGLAPPDANLHDTWLGVEPITGQTLDFHFRMGALLL